MLHWGMMKVAKFKIRDTKKNKEDKSMVTEQNKTKGQKRAFTDNIFSYDNDNNDDYDDDDHQCRQ